MIQFSRMGQVNRLHFLGIGGVGMAGIAEVLLNEGYQISGSEIKSNSLVERLEKLGATIYIGHQEENIIGADVVVRSTAISEDNIELKAARQARIPIVPRAAMLAELMRFRFSIAIAGTHGKTTTTSLTASVFAEAGKDPTYIIGGKLNSTQSNARLGKSPYLIAEADESDKSFLLLNPMMAVVTNIDADHLENYDGKFSNVKQAFIDFLHKMPFYGLAVLSADDPVIEELMPNISRPIITFGFSESADIRITHYRQLDMCSYFKLNGEDFCLSMPGKHNALNAAAAYIVAKQRDISNDAIRKALREFRGVGRRFQDKGLVNFAGKKVKIIDDYAHHPKEIAATIEAAKAAFPQQRLICVFQPHRFTRTQEQFDDYCRVLSQSDVLLLLNVYPAGETPIEGIDSKSLAKAIRQRKMVEPIVIEDDELKNIMDNITQEKDIVLVMGAGSISQIMNDLCFPFEVTCYDKKTEQGLGDTSC